MRPAMNPSAPLPGGVEAARRAARAPSHRGPGARGSRYRIGAAKLSTPIYARSSRATGGCARPGQFRRVADAWRVRRRQIARRRAIAQPRTRAQGFQCASTLIISALYREDLLCSITSDALVQHRSALDGSFIDHVRRGFDASAFSRIDKSIHRRITEHPARGGGGGSLPPRHAGPTNALTPADLRTLHRAGSSPCRRTTSAVGGDHGRQRFLVGERQRRAVARRAEDPAQVPRADDSGSSTQSSGADQRPRSGPPRHLSPTRRAPRAMPQERLHRRQIAGDLGAKRAGLGRQTLDVPRPPDSATVDDARPP